MSRFTVLFFVALAIARVSGQSTGISQLLDTVPAAVAVQAIGALDNSDVLQSETSTGIFSDVTAPVGELVDNFFTEDEISTSTASTEVLSETEPLQSSAEESANVTQTAQQSSTGIATPITGTNATVSQSTGSFSVNSTSNVTASSSTGVSVNSTASSQSAGNTSTPVVVEQPIQSTGEGAGIFGQLQTAVSAAVSRASTGASSSQSQGGVVVDNGVVTDNSQTSTGPVTGQADDQTDSQNQSPVQSIGSTGSNSISDTVAGIVAQVNPNSNSASAVTVSMAAVATMAVAALL